MYATPQTTDEILANPDVFIGILQNLKEERKAKEKAIKEKAWISTKREKTALATASKAVREKQKVLALIGHAKNTASVMAVVKVAQDGNTDIEEKLLHNLHCRGKHHITKITHPNIEANLWRPLSSWCKNNGVIVEKCQIVGELRTYKEVNTYPKGAWFYCYGVELEKIF